MKVNVR